jgi:hypothetical protein
MTARVITLPTARANLRAALRAPQKAPADDIDIVAKVGDAKTELYRLSTDLGFMLAGGNRPGPGTAARLRAIATDLSRIAAAGWLGMTPETCGRPTAIIIPISKGRPRGLLAASVPDRRASHPSCFSLVRRCDARTVANATGTLGYEPHRLGCNQHLALNL